jgi:radical SAM superfamily enzyme YgiQ (UPF0313 family)
MSQEPCRVWLCDLTYTQQTLSSDVMPAAVGHIASYCSMKLGDRVEIRVFKFPEKLAAALEEDLAPHIVGFSNYIWNCDLSSEFARVVKKHRPNTVTIAGGPNYPTLAPEQEEFLRAYPSFDFYIVKEGESAFTKLVEALMDVDFVVEAVPPELPSVHRVRGDGSFHAASTEDRITDLASIPSPYLSGLLDEFFDGVMLPIIQTNRGCPFRCTFCVEGQNYYSRVAKTKGSKTQQELEYIAVRMAELRERTRARSDLHIADSNFGMYKEDLEVCEHIAELQKRYKYPEYINVATGKNHKERVLEAAKLINGALRLSGSVQSLDKQILKNIDRSNINEDEIMQLALSASEIGANSYSEIILGLPGDNLASHLMTIQKIIEADFNTVALYQLMLLPGTDLASRDSVSKWGMQTRYRVLPRCFGYWDVLGESINAAEIEEVCIANNTMTVDEYIKCRKMHLIINVFYNDGVFKEALRLLRMLGLSKYEWIRRLWEYRGNDRFNTLMDAFTAETSEELWNDKQNLRSFTRVRDNIQHCISGEIGSNLIFKYKSLGLVEYTNDLAEVAISTLMGYLADQGASEMVASLARELIEFARLRMSNIFSDNEIDLSGVFEFDVEKFERTAQPHSVAEFVLDMPSALTFRLTAEQQRTISDFVAIYGLSITGLSRILSKVYVRRLFRHAQQTVGHLGDHLTLKEQIVGEGRLTGLNEFS